MNYLYNYNGSRTHNHLVYKGTLNKLAKLALSVCLWMWVRVNELYMMAVLVISISQMIFHELNYKMT